MTVESWGVLDNQHGVFDTAAVTAGDVDAGFDGYSHVRVEGGWHPVHAKLVRAFVDTEVGTDAVTCAVAVVLMILPHGVTGQDIELGAAGSVGEDGCGEADMALEDKSVVAPLLIGERAEGYRARDVCSAAVVLSTAVKEQEAVWLKGNICLRRCLVVNDGGVRPVACYGVEAEAAEAGLFGT